MKTGSRILLFILAAALLFPQPVAGAFTQYRWESIPLPAGVSISEVHAFAVHPLDSKTAFLGADSGLYKTTNTGDSWSMLGGVDNIIDVVIASSSPQRVFVRSWWDAHRSDDGGATWNMLTLPADNCGLWVAPSNAERVYAMSCSNGGYRVSKSTDAGAHWTSYATPMTEYFNTLVVAPNNPDIIIASTFDKSFRSTNGGQTWAALPVGTRYFAKPVFDPSPPYTLYLGHWTGLLRSADGGLTWEDSGADREFSSLIVSPMVSGTVLGGLGSESWLISSSGAAWQANAWNAPQPLEGLWRSLANSALASLPHVLYARTSDAFWRYVQVDLPSYTNQTYLPVIASDRNTSTGTVEARAALDRANLYRQRVGIIPLRLHPSIVAATQNHANYFMLNYNDPSAMANGAHGEVEGKPGFTGAWPGDRIQAAGFPWFGGSEVMHFIGDPLASVDGWMATVYHRFGILDPGAHYTGYGYAKSAHAAVDVMDFGGGPMDTGFWSSAQPHLLAYPANGQANVPYSWGGGESPNPLPPGASTPVGYPFTLQAVGGDLQVSAIEMRDGDGQFVAVHPNPAGCGTGCYALIAVNPLNPNTTYTVQAQGTIGGIGFNQQWIFTTSAAAGYIMDVEAK